MLQDKKLQMEKLNQYNDVVSIFYKETDRASAVLSASFLENLLEDYLRKFMITEKMVDNLFNGQGAFATFSSRISTCYALKYIPQNVYRDLDLIRKIRNYFAHNMNDASFDDEEIKNRINSFDFIRAAKFDIDKNSNKEKFLMTVGYITLFIMNQAIWTEDTTL
ncbi:MltR family transcriptional regulator [Paenibacillus sp. FSL E2-0230]|uniref:MltR family transcriptional regulator n=1 Tax=Paenibacillus sp. FSL E2-0230 TaxID=2954727 RepID=UPI0030D2239D